MAGKRKEKNQERVGDYRYEEARRKNNPSAGIAPTYEVRERRTTHYDHDPHLDPQLQRALAVYLTWSRSHLLLISSGESHPRAE